MHLGRVLKEFFGFDGGKCNFYDLDGEIQIGWNKDGNLEKWIISYSRGCSTPNEARTVVSNLLIIKDADLAQSLRDLLAKYPKCKIDLAKLVGIDEDPLLEERLNRYGSSRK